MTGEKGMQFAVAYIERFNQMENQLQKPNITKILLKTALEHEEQIEEIKSDVIEVGVSNPLGRVHNYELRQGEQCNSFSCLFLWKNYRFQ